MTLNERPTAAGFSLTELLVAMLVTMLVSGAVFGLLSAGQSSFRREPELTDRQQNIRLAMDLIQRDLAIAGAGLGDFDQVFTPGLNGANVVVPAGPTGTPSDYLEILGTDGECADMPVETFTAPLSLTSLINLPACWGTAGPVSALMPDLTRRWGFARGMATGTKPVNFTGTQPPLATVGGALPGAPTLLTRLSVVRYELANDTDGVPSLWRSATGGRNPADASYVAASPTAAAANGWQLVARGIEDLQVTYRAACLGPAGAFVTVPPVAAPATYTSLTQDVQVTVWARALAQNLQGQSQPAAGVPIAVRGSLTSMTTPRAVLVALHNPAAPPACLWN